MSHRPGGGGRGVLDLRDLAWPPWKPSERRRWNWGSGGGIADGDFSPANESHGCLW